MKIFDGIKVKKNHIHLFIGLVLIFGLYVLPIIIADRYYNDDLARSLMGLTGWNGDGRPLTEELMKLLSGGIPIADISPLPLLISVLILAYTITKYLDANFTDKSLGIAETLFFSLVIMNPFMLANLSYKYDVLSMIIALCVAFIPFVISYDACGIKQIIIVLIVTVTALSLYQVVICAICSLVLIDVLLMIIEDRINKKSILNYIIGIIFGSLLYKLVIAKIYISRGDWRLDASKVLIGTDENTLMAIKVNIVQIVSEISMYLRSIPVCIIVFIAIGVCVSSLFIIKENVLTILNISVMSRITRALFIVLLPVFLVGVNIIPLALVNGTGSKSRALLSVCVIELYIAIMFLNLSRKSKVVAECLIIPCVVFFLSYSYSFGNAEKSQKNYESYLTYNIVSDIETLNSDDKYNSLSIIGDAPKSQQVRMLTQKYPQFEEIVPVYIGNDWWTSGSQLYHYLQYNIVFKEPDSNDIAYVERAKPYVKNSIYSFYCQNDRIIIKFNSENQ